MCVAGGGCRLSVPQQSANNWQGQPATGTKAYIGVPQIMEADAIKTSTLCDGVPRTFEIGTRFCRIIARHDIRSRPLQTV